MLPYVGNMPTAVNISPILIERKRKEGKERKKEEKGKTKKEEEFSIYWTMIMYVLFEFKFYVEYNTQ